MSANAPIVFDQTLLAKRRARAVRTFAGVSFLKDRAVADLADRLEAIQRSFALGLELGAHGDHLRRELAGRGLLGTQTGSRVGHLTVSDPEPGFVAGLADAAVLDWEMPGLAPESLDLIVSALSLHWVNDLPGLFAQARRALRPDGLFLATFLGGRTLQELRAAFYQAEDELRGGAGARVSPFADSQDAARLLQRAGLALPVADSDVVTVRYGSPFGLLRDLKAMGETAAFADRAGRPLTRAVIARAADLYLAANSDPDGKVRATFELVTVTGWAPHASQQKPLRPGSAQMRLADALNSVEQSAGDKAG
jgi:SAM-dependent methyltransferase